MLKKEKKQLEKGENMAPKGGGNLLIDALIDRLIMKNIVPKNDREIVMKHLPSIIGAYEQVRKENPSDPLLDPQECDVQNLDMLSRRFQVWNDKPE